MSQDYSFYNMSYELVMEPQVSNNAYLPWTICCYVIVYILYLKAMTPTRMALYNHLWHPQTIHVRMSVIIRVYRVQTFDVNE